jgi:lysophospholipase L1-like esterase
MTMASRRDGQPRPRTRRRSVSSARKAFARSMILAAALATVVGLGIAALHRPGPDSRDVSTPHQVVRLTDEPATYPNAAFMGDSYTLGQGASVPALRWTSRVSRKMGWTEHNFGRGATGYLHASQWGPNYLGMLDEVAASNPDIVVVAGGQNDIQAFTTNSAPVSTAISDTFNSVRARLPNARIIAIGPSYPSTVTPSVTEFDSVVQDAAHAVGAEYVSLIAPTSVLQPYMLSPQFPGHPNDLGYAAIADRITSVLAPG